MVEDPGVRLLEDVTSLLIDVRLNVGWLLSDMESQIQSGVLKPTFTVKHIEGTSIILC
jgi:hypothetical protein